MRPRDNEGELADIAQMSLLSTEPVWLPSDSSKSFSPSIEYARAYLGLSSRDVEKKVKPRVILLTTPSNPTGTTLGNKELKAWYDLAREYGVALLLDETYRDFVVDVDEPETRRGLPHRLFEVDGWRDTLVSMGSFSSESLAFFPSKARQGAQSG